MGKIDLPAIKNIVGKYCHNPDNSLRCIRRMALELTGDDLDKTICPSGQIIPRKKN